MTFFDDLRNAFKYPNNGLMRLLAVNISVFVVLVFLFVFLWLFGKENYFQWLILQITLPANLNSLMYRPWTLFTYSFVHRLDFFHVIFNMLPLYWFGRIVMEYLGSKRLVGVFVVGSFVGGLLYILAYNTIPRLQPALASDSLRLMGASGGVYAIVVAAATIAPNYIISLFFFPIRIVYVAWLMVFLSFFEITSLNTGGNLAHLGGALFGYLFVKQLQRGTDLTAFATSFMGWVSGLFSAKPRMKVHYIKPQKTTVMQKTQAKQQSAKNENDTQGAVPNQDEVDRILDKISEKGYESLTKEEKQKLFDASRR